MSRQDAESIILTYIDKLLPGSQNRKIYEDFFKSLSDRQFDQWITQLEKGQVHLVLYAPNDGKHKLDVDRNIKIAKELGYDFFQQLTIDDGSSVYKTPIEHMVLDLPFRRTIQSISKKATIPKDNKSIDLLTYQPVNQSKGAKLSYPEIQLLSSLGAEQPMIELLKYRGGDKGGYRAMVQALVMTGRVSMSDIEPFTSGVVSTRTLKAMMTGMHLSSTL